MEKRTIEVAAGVHLYCELSGDPAAPAVVLLHALGDRASDWAPVVAALARHFYVVNLDLRGHGDSDWPGSYSLEAMRDDVMAVLDTMALSNVILIGHSLGGVIAYLLAEAQPNRIRRLIVEDAVPPFPRTRTLPEQPDGELSFDWPVVAAISEQINDPTRRWWTRLPEITAPTLLIGGGPSSHLPQQLLIEVAQLIPHCTLNTMDFGHNIHESAPAEFVDTVMAWLGGPASNVIAFDDDVP